MDTRAGPADRRSGRFIRVPMPVGVRLTTLQRLGATGGIAAIVLLLGLLTYAGLSSTRSARESVIRTHRAIEATQAVLQDVTNAETGQRGFLLSANERYLAPYHQALNRLAADTALLRTFAGTDPVQKSELDSLATAVQTKVAELGLTIAIMRTKGPDAARIEVDSDRGKRAMDDIRGLLSNIATRQQALLDQRIAESDRHYNLSEVFVVAGTTTAIVIALMLNTLLTRFANEQADAAHRLDAQNRELADTNHKLSELTVELELQNQQLQDQAVEMESQQSHLQEQAAEMEVQSEELRGTIEQLEHQTSLAEKAREEAEEATKSAEEANRAKSLFLTTMSHELRTPLNAIGGYVDLLALEIRGPLVDAQREDLRRIKKSGQHLLSLINDILNLAKIESGQLDLHVRDVSLAVVFENVDTLVAPQFNSKGIAYVFPQCDPMLHVRADSDKLQQILLNVLSNACKFTGAGGRVTVACDTKADGDHGSGAMVSIAVRDTGRGIAQDKLEKIFEPFVQIDRHLTGVSQQGVGLGLAISRDLARSMSGDLVAESVMGAGTMFVLTIPRAGAVSGELAPSPTRASTDPISTA
ncbi:MAG TPA: CHASE3 domain-containing protein [Gemmatimonadaceae bacterium]|nr:CHASE3 domain-containing protein [Gemmatimonadaceae bacterium]